jgi:hypothetical protein
VILAQNLGHGRLTSGELAFVSWEGGGGDGGSCVEDCVLGGGGEREWEGDGGGGGSCVEDSVMGV